MYSLRTGICLLVSFNATEGVLITFVECVRECVRVITEIPLVWFFLGQICNLKCNPFVLMGGVFCYVLVSLSAFMYLVRHLTALSFL